MKFKSLRGDIIKAKVQHTDTVEDLKPLIYELSGVHITSF